LQEKQPDPSRLWHNNSAQQLFILYVVDKSQLSYHHTKIKVFDSNLSSLVFFHKTIDGYTTIPKEKSCHGKEK
jgi:hypothetical protein